MVLTEELWGDCSRKQPTLLILLPLPAYLLTLINYFGFPHTVSPFCRQAFLEEGDSADQLFSTCSSPVPQQVLTLCWSGTWQQHCSLRCSRRGKCDPWWQSPPGTATHGRFQPLVGKLVLWPNREGWGERTKGKKRNIKHFLPRNRHIKSICSIGRPLDVQAPLTPETQTVFKRLRNISDNYIC